MFLSKEIYKLYWIHFEGLLVYLVFHILLFFSHLNSSFDLKMYICIQSCCGILYWIMRFIYILSEQISKPHHSVLKWRLKLGLVSSSSVSLQCLALSVLTGALEPEIEVVSAPSGVGRRCSTVGSLKHTKIQYFLYFSFSLLSHILFLKLAELFL